MIINFSQEKNLEYLEGCVLTCGHFNTIHPGHIRYLKNAKEEDNKLVVALFGDSNNDNEKAYQFNQFERAESLLQLSIVDEILCIKGRNIEEIIEKIKPKKLILGKEFEKTKDYEMQKAIKMQKSLNGNISFHAGDFHYATTELLGNSEKDLSSKRKNDFIAACKKQKLDYEKIINSISNWKNANLIVIGDLIIDQYAACEPLGLSAEAPVVVVKELERKNFLGGAAIVASHIKSLGAKCNLISVIGKDSMAEYARKELIKMGIGDSLVEDNSRPTTFKKRYVVENQKLFRVSQLEDHKLTSEVEKSIINNLEKLAPYSGGIVISDFVYGVITENILKKISKLSKEYNLLLFGDLQCSSQVDSILKFKDFSLLCPNEKEARIALQNRESGLEAVSKELIEKTRSENLIMKLGPEGFIIFKKNHTGGWNSQSFPALTVNPLDVAGAGDSLLSVMATGMTSSQNVMCTAAVAACMSALAVQNMGNKPIDISSLKHMIDKIFL